MQFPLPQITTFLLTLHMVLGCCTHHTHGCESDCCSVPAATTEACPCGTHRNDGLTTDSTNGVIDFAGSRDHGERHDCAGDDCTFVHSQPTPNQNNASTADICPLDLVAADDDSSHSHLDCGLDQRLSIAGSTLRRHLVLRVLLI